jgi:peptidoglycan hydrolase-like protein with peptidoglycan-binding domain
VALLADGRSYSGHYTGPVTGYFGPLTSEAVRKYQRANGLEAVGALGPKTRALLNREDGGQGMNAGAPAVLGARTNSPSNLSAQMELLRQLIALASQIQQEITKLQANNTR